MPDTPRFTPAADPTPDAASGKDDVNELRRVAREAEAARLQAEAALAAKDELLATLAHELRTPLASMLLHVQLLREGGLSEKRDLRRIADSLERAVQQQTQLIDQLRDGSQHPARELTLERRVHVDSLDDESPKPGRGAGWTLSFPLSSAADGASTDQTTPIPRRSLARPGKLEQYERLKDMRILCIDDDFITREAVWEVLELTGAQVALAASTADGMMALDTFKPHVIVCDLAMPGEDGYTFMRKLRAYEAGRGAQIPVLAFTGLASVEDKRDALAAGFQMYLSKPIDIDRLRDAIAQLVGLIGSQDGPSPKT